MYNYRFGRNSCTWGCDKNAEYFQNCVHLKVAEEKELRGFGRELIWTRNINSISICRIAKGRGIRQVQRPG